MATVDTSRSPSLAEFVTNAVESHARDAYHAGPAAVQSYNPATQTVVVQPQIKKQAVNPDGSQVAELRPTIGNVPVVWPTGGRFRISFPILPGDTGLLIYCDQSLDVWKSGGGIVDPADFRLNDINDAVFIPGLHPNNKPWTTPSSVAIQIGQDGAAPDFVATLKALQALATVFTSWTPAAGDGGLALKTLLTTLITTNLWPAANVSKTVQILG